MVFVAVDSPSFSAFDEGFFVGTCNKIRMKSVIVLWKEEGTLQ
jgi:hypothetical protein